MASSSVFDLLKGELVDIAEYSVDRYEKTGKPLRLAVNGSSWWYANMTNATVQEIRNRGGIELNPIERNILFYTLNILYLGIELHFVFDGPRRLNNGGKLHPGHDAPSSLLQDTLTHIGVPWHEAPVEAEAECAKMEKEELVHGVWSEDGDALAFGCQNLIRFHREVKYSTENRKSFTHFKLYRLDDLAEKYDGMNREGFVLHTILNGRPDDVGELYNLEPQDILNAARHGLGQSLCSASTSDHELRKWATTNLTVFLKAMGSDIPVPKKFPTWSHVQDYLNPITSSREELIRHLQTSPPIDEKELISFLESKFQWTTKQWVQYSVPLRIIQSLLATPEGKESQHDKLKLEWDHKNLSSKKARVKVTFLLSKATSVDVSALYQTRGELMTLMWVLRKANFNQQRSIASYFITPTSNQKEKGKGKSSTRASVSASTSTSGAGFGFGVPSRKLDYRSTATLPTPETRSASRSKGNDTSETERRERDRAVRQATPPSPTPTSRKRKLPWLSTNSTSLSQAAKTDHDMSVHSRDSAIVREKGKGKETDVRVSQSTSSKGARLRSDEDANLNTAANVNAIVDAEQDQHGNTTENSGAAQQLCHSMSQMAQRSQLPNQRPSDMSTQPNQQPSTPPAQMMDTTDTAHGFDIMSIGSDFDIDVDLEADADLGSSLSRGYNSDSDDYFENLERIVPISSSKRKSIPGQAAIFKASASPVSNPSPAQRSILSGQRHLGTSSASPSQPQTLALTQDSNTTRTTNSYSQPFLCSEDEDEDDCYGSFPSIAEADLEVLLEGGESGRGGVERKGVRSGDISLGGGDGESGASGDEYGSFPASPDLRALV